MDWITKILSYIGVGTAEKSKQSAPSGTKSVKQPIITGTTKAENPREIKVLQELSDKQIQINQERTKYITTTKNPDYKVQNGDNIEKIAEKYGIEKRSLLNANGLSEESATKIRPGQTLKIPNTRKIKNVNNLSDVAKSMGVSLDFVKKLKRAEDGEGLPENKFHNTPYTDKAGVRTIGIGHVLKPKDPQNLTDQQVCALCAKDLLRMEDNIVSLLGGQRNYDRLPPAMKEALLDMTFNKGTAILEKTPGLIYCLKEGKYEAAINKMTHNKSAKTNQEMSGLSKRRLLDISIAMQLYRQLDPPISIPKSNINTAQQVYNRGIELLRAECKKDGSNFANIVVGYNKDVASYLGNKITLVTK